VGYDTQSLGLEAYKYWTNAAYRQRAGAGVGVSAAPDAPAASAVKATTEATRADVLDTESVLFEDAPLASEGTRSDLCVCVCVLRVYPLSVMLLLLRARVDETQPWVVATVSRTEELQTRSYGGTRETRHVRALVAHANHSPLTRASGSPAFNASERGGWSGADRCHGGLTSEHWASDGYPKAV